MLPSRRGRYETGDEHWRLFDSATLRARGQARLRHSGRLRSRILRATSAQPAAHHQYVRRARRGFCRGCVCARARIGRCLHHLLRRRAEGCQHDSRGICRKVTGCHHQRRAGNERAREESAAAPQSPRVRHAEKDFRATHDCRGGLKRPADCLSGDRPGAARGAALQTAGLPRVASGPCGRTGHSAPSSDRDS